MISLDYMGWLPGCSLADLAWVESSGYLIAHLGLEGPRRLPDMAGSTASCWMGCLTQLSTWALIFSEVSLDSFP